MFNLEEMIDQLLKIPCTWVVCGEPSKEVKVELVAFLARPLAVQQDATKLDDVFFPVSASRQMAAEGSVLSDAESINISSDLLAFEFIDAFYEWSPISVPPCCFEPVFCQIWIILLSYCYCGSWLTSSSYNSFLFASQMVIKHVM